MIFLTPLPHPPNLCNVSIRFQPLQRPMPCEGSAPLWLGPTWDRKAPTRPPPPLCILQTLAHFKGLGERLLWESNTGQALHGEVNNRTHRGTPESESFCLRYLRKTSLETLWTKPTPGHPALSFPPPNPHAESPAERAGALRGSGRQVRAPSCGHWGAAHGVYTVHVCPLLAVC